MRYSRYRLSSLLLPLLHLSSPFASAQTITPASLSSALSSDTTTSIQGQALSLPPFDCTILSNLSHAVISFNVSRPLEKVGYVAIGFGTAMADSAMVILYPDDSGTWTLSLRESQGRDAPEQRSYSTAENPFVLLPALTYSSADYTLVSFLRPLALPSSQTFYTHDKHLNLSQSGGQEIIYAFSDSRPRAEGDGEVEIEQHGGGEFGRTTVNLGVIFDVDKGSTLPDWTRYDTVILIHGAMAMVTWLFISPGAVLIGRLGRKWGKWFNWHWSIQAFLTFPLTIGIIVLGVLAANWGPQSGWDFHKAFGFLILIACILQGIFGWWAHVKIDSNRISRPWRNLIHLVLGIVLLIAAWVQISTGFSEYTGRPIPASVRTIFYIVILSSLSLYLISIVLLALSRHREGRSWYSSLFGLGRDGASVRAGREGETLGMEPYVPDDPMTPKGEWRALRKQGGEDGRE